MTNGAAFGDRAVPNRRPNHGHRLRDIVVRFFIYLDVHCYFDWSVYGTLVHLGYDDYVHRVFSYDRHYNVRRFGNINSFFIRD
ncbi:Hypothetical protein PHPALM_10186 [Phytophthora palmivora]|uniref:Uncharacterized protein n=1 Tax=Phytophthora palmivora TaxID=4796 RepID=A0A2P4Y5D2_9STRA|nr:Hypothetical protein PHPALM_10186 [Phytophthora palmivora]